MKIKKIFIRDNNSFSFQDLIQVITCIHFFHKYYKQQKRNTTINYNTRMAIAYTYNNNNTGTGPYSTERPTRVVEWIAVQAIAIQELLTTRRPGRNLCKYITN